MNLNVWITDSGACVPVPTAGHYVWYSDNGTATSPFERGWIRVSAPEYRRTYVEIECDHPTVAARVALQGILRRIRRDRTQVIARIGDTCYNITDWLPSELAPLNRQLLASAGQNKSPNQSPISGRKASNP